jgi:RNA polymerase sigma-70 factor (ECF subfamily)
MSADLEQLIMQALQAGDGRAATERAVQGYGPELFSFLLALTKDEDEAADVFSDVCERLWQGIQSFRGESSFRTWLYAIARHAHSHYVQEGYRRKRRKLSDFPDLERIEAEVRTRTMTFLRTETKTAIQRLRETLSSEEQMLLILRIDRGLSWSEIAEVLLEPGEARTEASLHKASQNCRKRFERTKEKLRAMARKEGLLG